MPSKWVKERIDRLLELLPAVILLVLVMSMLAFGVELLTALAADRPADAVTMSVIGTLIAASISALVPLYLRESIPTEKPPDPPEPPDDPTPVRSVERTGDLSSDEWNERHGWLQMWGRLRWRRP
jgi:hypothetical protein